MSPRDAGQPGLGSTEVRPRIGTDALGRACRPRSIHEFAEVGLGRSDIGELMWAAQGISGGDGLRAAPSAGALYPLTVHVAIAEGLYRYQPAGHRLVRTPVSDIRVLVGGLR